MMMNAMSTDQLAPLRSIVFGAIDAWNTNHPQALHSRRERGCVNVAQVYADASGAPTYTITIVCALAGPAPLTFHGHDLAATVEHACVTVERRIEHELRGRALKVSEYEAERKYGVAV
jgi:hypothetical protein